VENDQVQSLQPWVVLGGRMILGIYKAPRRFAGAFLTIFLTTSAIAEAQVIEKSSQEKQSKVNYNVGRGFYDYTRILNSSATGADSDTAFFKDASVAQSWLDIGAGGMLAQLDWIIGESESPPFAPFWRYNDESVSQSFMDYKKHESKKSAVGVSVENVFHPNLNKLIEQHQIKNVKYLAGRYIEDYADGELGKFDLITDVYGAVSYSPQVDVVFEKALSHLKIGGRFYTNIESEDVQHTRDGLWNLRFEDSDSDQVGSIRDWVNNMSCISGNVTLGPPGTRQQIVIQIEKTCDAVTVPKLKLIKLKEASPPARTYSRIK
jgi:hypothetical protein